MTIRRSSRNWFDRFKAGNLASKDEDRNGRPATTNTDVIKAMLAENPRCSVLEVVDATNIPRLLPIYNTQSPDQDGNRRDVWVWDSY